MWAPLFALWLVVGAAYAGAQLANVFPITGKQGDAVDVLLVVLRSAIWPVLAPVSVVAALVRRSHRAGGG